MWSRNKKRNAPSRRSCPLYTPGRTAWGPGWIAKHSICGRKGVRGEVPHRIMQAAHNSLGEALSWTGVGDTHLSSPPGDSIRLPNWVSRVRRITRTSPAERNHLVQLRRRLRCKTLKSRGHKVSVCQRRGGRAESFAYRCGSGGPHLAGKQEAKRWPKTLYGRCVYSPVCRQEAQPCWRRVVPSMYRSPSSQVMQPSPCRPSFKEQRDAQ